MLKLVLAFYFATYYFSAIIKQTAGQPSVVRRKQFNNTHLRVYHGQDIENGKYPFAVVLFVFHESCSLRACRFCTASMITESWVITAAHCFHRLPLDVKIYYVWYGNYTVPPSESELFSLVLDILVHPGYRFNYFEVDNDISLLRVHPISLQRYGRLSSVDYTTMIGLPIKYVGGGFTDKLGDDGARLLQLGEGTVVSCGGEFRGMTRYLICISPSYSNRLARPYRGDSGGPLLYDERIVGVLSFGLDLDMIAKDGYTPVSPYIDWIYEVTRPK